MKKKTTTTKYEMKYFKANYQGYKLKNYIFIKLQWTYLTTGQL